MTQTVPQNSISATFNTTFNATHLRKGQTLLVIPIPDDAALLIGRIATAWGGFEIRIDGVIRFLNEVYNFAEPQWERKPFRKRNALFRDLVKKYAESVGIEKCKPLLSASSQAAALHWKRNTIIHGYYNMRATAGDGSQVSFVAAATHKGKKVEIQINSATLDKLYHDIAHLGGALMSGLLAIGASFTAPEILIDDTDLLQDQPRGSFQMRPIPQTPAHLRTPSEA